MGPRVEGGQLVDDFQLLADLQHFGVPTRLVDVTSNPMTALWFATEQAFMSTKQESSRRSKPGMLIAMNMPWYNEVDRRNTLRPCSRQSGVRRPC